MFKVISTEIKKIVSKPGIFVLAVLLAVILVLGVFIYNPTEYKSDSEQLSGTNFNEIYNKFINTTGFKVNADNNVSNTIELIESYSINDTNYKEYVKSLQDKLKDSIKIYTEATYYGNISKEYIDKCRNEVCSALDNLYATLDSAIKLGAKDAFPILTTKKNYNNIKSYYEEGKEFISTEVDKEKIASRCSDFNKQYGSKLDNAISNLIFPTLPEDIIINYSSEESGSKLYTVTERLNNIMADIDKLVETAGGDPTVQQTADLRELCTKYIDTANTYKHLVNYELISNAFSFVDTSKQINMYYLSDYDSYNVNTNLIRYSYIFKHKLTESDFAHPLTIGTTSNNEKNGYDYAYFSLRLFSFVIIAYAIMNACHAIAGEIKDGSMRYLAIRPVNRTKILFGKMLSIILMSTIFAIFSTVIALLVGGVVYGMDSAKILTIFNGTTAITLHPLVMLLIYMVSMMIELIIYVSIALLLSCLLKSDLFAVTIMILLYLINTLLPAFVGNPTSWLAFYPFSHISLYSLFGSSVYANNGSFLNSILSAKVFTNTSLALTLIVVALICIIINVVSSVIFKRKEL